MVAGRDIGVVVLPDADVKVWLDASAEERAARRASERGIDPASPAGLAILDDLRRRDARGRLARSLAGPRRRRCRPRPHRRQHVRRDGRGRSRGGACSACPPGGSPVTEPARRHQGQQAEVFALPADHLPPVIRASDAFGRSFIQCFTRVTVEGLEHAPSAGPLIVAGNHISNADPPFLASLAHAGAGAADPLDGEGGGARVAPRSAGSCARTAPSGSAAGPPTPRRSASRRASSTMVASSAPSPKAPAARPAPSSRPRTASRCSRCGPGAPILPVGVIGHRPVLAARPEALGRRRPDRPPTSASPSSWSGALGPDGTQGIDSTTSRLRLMLRIAALLPERHRGVYAGPSPRARPAPIRVARGKHSGRRASPPRTTADGLCPGGFRQEACNNRAMGMVQDVRIAKRTGFCYGVREAVDKAKEVGRRRSDDAYPWPGGPQRGRRLRPAGARRGVDRAASTRPRAGSTVVIRAHGVTPSVRDSAAARGLDVIDGTCSWVIAEQKQLQKLVEEGYTIVLLGTPNHPEVVGLLGFAPDAIVVDDEEDWDRIPRKKRMALITQSTQPPWKFERLAARMVHLAHELKIVNTVCPVTIRRQEDTVETAREVDFMVVVGGRSSANTKELTRLCEIVGTPVMQIEHARDLHDASVFGDAADRRRDGRDVHPDRGPRARRGAGPGDGRDRQTRRRAPGSWPSGPSTPPPRRPGRTSSLPAEPAAPDRARSPVTRPGGNGSTPGRPPRPDRPRRRRRLPVERGRLASRRRDRWPPQRRQEHPLQPAHRRQPRRDRRGPRPDDARPHLRRGRVEWPPLPGRRYRRPRDGAGRRDRGEGPGAGATRDRRGRRDRLRGRRDGGPHPGRRGGGPHAAPGVGAPVFVAVNKADNAKRELDAAEFWALGWDQTWPISAAHGRGVADLLDEIVLALPPESEAELARKAREDRRRTARPT